MLAYLQKYYIELSFGPGYVFTELFFVIGLVLTFEAKKTDLRKIRKVLGRILLTIGASFGLSSIYYQIFGINSLSKVVTALLVLGFCLFTNRNEFTIRLVRGSVYYACYTQILTISEPLGRWLEAAFGNDKRWLEHSTWIAVLILIILIILVIKIWSVEDMIFVPAAPAYLVIMASLLGIGLQYSADSMGISKEYRLIVAGTFWLLEMISYYLFYMVSMESKKNVENLAIAHKEQMNEEMLETFRDNLERMHLVRHEIKNHLAYIRVLVAKQEFDKLFDYTNAVLGENEELFSTISSGNDLVDAILNHLIEKGKKQGITFETQIIVPGELPFEETDFCSILSNLMENAMEATLLSEKKNSGIQVSIQPRQDYLFIRIMNPVRNDISRKRILSLRTTKKDSALHGYGTKVVKNIVEKYQGSLKFDVRDGNFIVDVMLDLNVQKKMEL